MTLTRHQILALAGIAQVDPGAVARLYAGAAVRAATITVVTAAAARLGYPPPPGAVGVPQPPRAA